MREIEKIVRQINEKIKDELFIAKYIKSDETEIVILEDYESNYFETVVIHEDKAHFFGDETGVISKEEYISILKENWELS